MINVARINEALKLTEGLDWTTALRAPALRPMAKAGILPLSLFDQQD